MPNDRQDAEIVGGLYRKYVTEAGFAHPTTHSELQAIIVASGINVDIRGDSPSTFTGMQIAGTIFINGHMSPFKQIRALAHEWFHALRWVEAEMPNPIAFYAGIDGPGAAREESRARLFEQMF